MAKNDKMKLSGNEKLVIVTTKGGVGKSTFASQVLVSFLYAHNGGKKVKYIEIDDENKSANLFAESEIMLGQKIPVEKSIDISVAMTKNENVVIDIGGNNVASTVIKSIGENEDFDNVFWFIPVDTGKISVQNALNTYLNIMEIYTASSDEPKIMFVLNGSSGVESKELEDLKMEFAYYFGSDWMELDFSFLGSVPDRYANNFVFFNRFDNIMLSTALKKLAVEIASEDFMRAASEAKKIKLAELAIIEDKYNKGEVSEEDYLLVDKDKRKAIATFNWSKKTKNYVENSIVVHYPKLLQFVVS